MKKVTSEISACRKTLLLWNELAKTGSTTKHVASKKLFGRVYYHNNCPCCEFSLDEGYDWISTDEDCQTCPLQGFWGPKIEPYACESNSTSPWGLWINSDNGGRKVLAAGIASLAREALEYWEAMRDMNLTY